MGMGHAVAALPADLIFEELWLGLVVSTEMCSYACFWKAAASPVTSAAKIGTEGTQGGMLIDGRVARDI